MSYEFQELITHELPFAEFSQYIKAVAREKLTTEELDNQETINKLEKEGWTIKGGEKIMEQFKIQEIKAAIINVLI